MKKRTAKLLKGLGIILIGLGLVYAILLGMASAKLHNAYRALERDKRPMKPEDVIPVELSDTENAALLYESAWLRLKAEPGNETDLLSHLAELAEPYNQGEPNTATRAEMERLLQTDAVKSALQVFELGLQRPGCRFDINYTGGIDMQLPHLSSTRNLARILAARALIQAQKGDTEDAWQCIVGLLRLADHLRTEPILVSQLVRMAIARLAAETVCQFPDMALPSASQMATLNDLLVKLENCAPVVRAFDGERILFGESIFASGHQAQEQLEEAIMSEHPMSTVLIHAYRLCKPLIRHDHAYYLRIIHGYAKMGEQPYDAREQQRIAQLTDRKPKYLVISGLLVPAGNRVYRMHNRMIARLRIMHVGMALLRYRQAQGEFPASLGMLDSGIAQDPFGENPLIYRREGNGFLLYSVDWDLEDNGGIPKQPNIEKWDIPWHYKGEPSAAQ